MATPNLHRLGTTFQCYHFSEKRWAYACFSVDLRFPDPFLELCYRYTEGPFDTEFDDGEILSIPTHRPSIKAALDLLNNHDAGLFAFLLPYRLPCPQLVYLILHNRLRLYAKHIPGHTIGLVNLKQPGALFGRSTIPPICNAYVRAFYRDDEVPPTHQIDFTVDEEDVIPATATTTDTDMEDGEVYPPRTQDSPQAYYDIHPLFEPFQL